LFVTALAFVALAPAANATFPGANGKIAFSGPLGYWNNPSEDSQIETINGDGSARSVLIPAGHQPSWSPDGIKIAYASPSAVERGLWIADADGSNAHSIINPTGNNTDFLSPTWSPDQTKLAYTVVHPCNEITCVRNQLWLVNADGTGATQVTGGGLTEPYAVKWSPDGSWLLVKDLSYPTGSVSDPNQGIWLVRPDGSDSRHVCTCTTNAFAWSPDASRILVNTQTMKLDNSDQRSLGFATDFVPGDGAFSPDGSKIVLSGCINTSSGCAPRDLWVTNADGTGHVDITNTPNVDESLVDWQPIPATYVRPRGASPLLASLVPAYGQCTNGNRTHGAPLAFPSCAPPIQRSGWLTVGTPDSNFEPANSVSSVRYTVQAGNPATTADVKIAASMSDIRNKSDLSDYAGELQVVSVLRISDRDNTPNPGGPGPATVVDTPLSVTVPCTPTPAAPHDGSLCAVSTSANAIASGTVKEGKRAIWGMDQVLAYDGGQDGLAATHDGETVFLDQGLFVP
jgi:hypothetical protein